jgi:hypothetical protein
MATSFRSPKGLISGLCRLWQRRARWDVVADGVAVGCIFLSPTAPKHRPWMWTSDEHKGRPPLFGYEATREDAMAAFAKCWHREM